MLSLFMFWLPLVLIAVGVYMSKQRKSEIIGKLLALFCAAIVTFFVGFVAFIIVSFSSVYADYHIVIILILGIAVLLFVSGALWGWVNKKFVYIPLSVIAVSCLLTYVGLIVYEQYINNIPTVQESYGLWAEYEPYAKYSKVAELGEESNLVLEGDVPKMDGATALYPVYSAFAKAVYPRELLDLAEGYSIYSNEYLRCNTTKDAYYNIVTGDVDIIFVAAPSAEQKQFARENGVELIYTPIGKEAFVFFVNSKNPIESLSVEQIQDIYSGKITAWEELGIKKLGDIKAFQREEGSGSQSALIRIMSEKELMKAPEEDVITGMGGIITKTADYKNFKNAIGYSFRFYSTEMVEESDIKLLNIEGIAPDIENIENGTYPLASHFYAVTRSNMTDNTQKLLDWILSEQGQKLIELAGYTPIK